MNHSPGQYSELEKRIYLNRVPPPSSSIIYIILLFLFNYPDANFADAATTHYGSHRASCASNRPNILRRNKTFLLCMYFYITLHCIGYSPSIPLSKHQGPTILYYPPSLGPIPLLRVPSSSYSLLLTASLYDPVSGSNRWNPCTHVHPCQVHRSRKRRWSCAASAPPAPAAHNSYYSAT